MQEIFAERVKELRTSLGFNQSQFSKISGVSRDAIIKLEKGVKPQIAISDLFGMLSMGLDITPAPREEIKINKEKELKFFEKCINEDKELLSSFINYLKMNKEQLKSYTLSGIGG